MLDKMIGILIGAKQHALCLKLNGGLETNRRLVSDMAVQQPSDEGFLLPEIRIFFSKSCFLHPAIYGGCVCYAYDEKIRLAWSHQEFFGSMASAKYLMLSSERNVKRWLQIRISKTSEEHLQIWSDEIVDLLVCIPYVPIPLIYMPCCLFVHDLMHRIYDQEVWLPSI